MSTTWVLSVPVQPLPESLFGRVSCCLDLLLPRSSCHRNGAMTPDLILTGEWGLYFPFHLVQCLVWYSLRRSLLIALSWKVIVYYTLQKQIFSQPCGKVAAFPSLHSPRLGHWGKTGQGGHVFSCTDAVLTVDFCQFQVGDPLHALQTSILRTLAWVYRRRTLGWGILMWLRSVQGGALLWSTKQKGVSFGGSFHL